MSPMDTGSLKRKAVVRMVSGFVVLGAVFCGTAGTIRYWEGWAYILVLLLPMSIVIGTLLRENPELLEEICGVIAAHRRDMWIDIHQLRARRAGAHVFMDFHLILPRDLSLEESHEEVIKLEKILNDYFAGQADILIHADPCMEPVCPICGHEPCVHRRAATTMQRLWRSDTLTCNGPHKTPDQSGQQDDEPLK